MNHESVEHGLPVEVQVEYGAVVPREEGDLCIGCGARFSREKDAWELHPVPLADVNALISSADSLSPARPVNQTPTTLERR